ncbi:MAG: hypothetical protein LC768_06675 [Acidobacteria bacterium]|nr:hypothetical protein [Acidobacteriota bacterium]MCA1638008.1 hypothetical protein [Acidobacteriota bacterium]
MNYNAPPNNSMDVRAKHGRCLVCQLARCFALRHLKRSAASCNQTRCIHGEENYDVDNL